MDLGLNGKVALVTASSQGLGRAVALGLAREGARLSICSRDEAAINAVADEIRGFGGEVLAQVADLTSPEEINRLVDSTVEQFGGINVLVTNAGGPPGGTFDRFQDDAAWDAAYNLTLMSAVRLIRATLPSMRSRGGGSIITMTSSSVKQPIPNLLLSNVFRAGVAALAKSLADDLAKEGIRVNNLVPGRISTQRIAQLDQGNAEREGVDISVIRQRSLAAIPMGRLGEPDEFADMAVFLASERASYITGSTFQVDGGQMRSLW